MRRYKFTVTPKHKDGALSFPMDMLRYDRCYPITSLSARDISMYGNVLPQTQDWFPVIELQSNDRYPTLERWESQGWTVINVEAFRS